MYGRRRKLSAEETAANAARKQRKMLESKTCQCCWRQIFAETGTIAHHGYERPGGGYQTASCMGARHLPLEVSRDQLGKLIKLLVDREAQQIELRRQTDKEERPVLQLKTNTNALDVPRDHHGRRQYPTIELAFTRANFEQLIAENTGEHRSGKLFDGYTALVMKQRGFDDIKDAQLQYEDHQIQMTREHIAECHTHFDNWKQTHKRVNYEWVEA